MKRAIAIVLMVEGRDLPDDATIISFVQKKIDMSPRYAANITIGLPATAAPLEVVAGESVKVGDVLHEWSLGPVGDDGWHKLKEPARVTSLNGPGGRTDSKHDPDLRLHGYTWRAQIAPGNKAAPKKRRK